MKIKSRLTIILTLIALAGLGDLLGIDFPVQGREVVVPAGEYKTGGRVVKVTEAARLTVVPGPFLTIKDEALKLSADKPEGWKKGAHLRGMATTGVNAFGSFDPGSLEIRKNPGDEPLKEGEDYLVDSGWGHVGLGPRGRVTAKDTVFASYRYSQLRMDTIQVSADGKATLKIGSPHISTPVPPEPDAGCAAIAHVFVPYRATDVSEDQIYPITETSEQATTRTTPGRIPKALAKLKAGLPVKIVCLGDSVTVGANASVPELNYVNVFAAGLRERFPQAKIEVENISAGGSNSQNWRFPEKFAYNNLHGDANPARFQRVVDAKPDLVTIEFVNDANLNAQQVQEAYSDILQRLNPVEVILITPHFTKLDMMGFTNMRGTEQRPYVLALREFANSHNVALADASSRWEHLWKEGLPYLTLLHNTINHPEDRGHRLFAEELWKCFE